MHIRINVRLANVKNVNSYSYSGTGAREKRRIKKDSEKKKKIKVSKIKVRESFRGSLIYTTVRVEEFSFMASARASIS